MRRITTNMGLTTSFAATLYIASFALHTVAAAAADSKLSFIKPGQPLVNGEGLPYYTLGQDVNITWTTDYRRTTLQLFQQRTDGSFASEVLADSYPPDRTTYTWRAETVGPEKLGGAFHFALQNTDNVGCRGCEVNSTSFNLTQTATTTSSSSSSSPSSSSKTSTSTSTTNPSQTETSQTASAIATTGDVSPSSSGNHLAVGLGVGLGVGIPASIALVALVFYCLRRRRRSLEPTEILPRGRQPGDGAMRESSAALAPIPAEFLSLQTSTAGLSQRTTATTTTTASSQHSYHEPFDFERPEMREHDAMSQLRASIHSSRDGPRRSTASLIGTDLSSLTGIPELPQPVVHMKD